MNSIMIISKTNMVANWDCYSDTDSFVYDTETENVGKMKDEMDGIAIEEFGGLKPKMYSILVIDFSGYKKAKGVNKNIVAEISYNEYKNVLLHKKCLQRLINTIQSKNHTIGTLKSTEFLDLALTPKLIFLIMELMC